MFSGVFLLRLQGVTADPVSFSLCSLSLLVCVTEEGEAVTDDILFDFSIESADRGIE